MWKVWMIALLVAVLAAVSDAQGADKEDEVFMDLGADGDFGEVPMAPSKPDPVAKETDRTTESSDAVLDEKASSSGEEEHEAAARRRSRSGPNSKFGSNSNPAPAKNAKSTKPVKSGGKTGDPGLFVTTKVPCPMRREPASESEQISTTKAPRKIWVQKFDDKWVKAYTKSGEAGYLSTECFEDK